MKSVEEILALEDDTIVRDVYDALWLRTSVEREWNGYDAPYDVLVPIEDGETLWSEAQNLTWDDRTGYTQEFLAEHGPFTVVIY